MAEIRWLESFSHPLEAAAREAVTPCVNITSMLRDSFTSDLFRLKFGDSSMQEAIRSELESHATEWIDDDRSPVVLSQWGQTVPAELSVLLKVAGSEAVASRLERKITVFAKNPDSELLAACRTMTQSKI